MRHLTRQLTLSTLLTLSLGVSLPALADGDLVCNSGNPDNWKPMKHLKKKIWIAGWELQKAQVEGDCYEVYARLRNGQAIEAFFHPVTLEKLAVYRRGELIFQKPGFQIGG